MSVALASALSSLAALAALGALAMTAPSANYTLADARAVSVSAPAQLAQRKQQGSAPSELLVLLRSCAAPCATGATALVRNTLAAACNESCLCLLPLSLLRRCMLHAAGGGECPACAPLPFAASMHQSLSALLPRVPGWRPCSPKYSPACPTAMQPAPSSAAVTSTKPKAQTSWMTIAARRPSPTPYPSLRPCRDPSGAPLYPSRMSC